MIRLHTLLKLVLAARMLLLGAHMPAQAADAPVKLQGLRGGTPVNQDNAPGAFKQERDHGPADRDFVQQPPLIPHTVRGYDITVNFNKCMDCHAWSRARWKVFSTSGLASVCGTWHWVQK